MGAAHGDVSNSLRPVGSMLRSGLPVKYANGSSLGQSRSLDIHWLVIEEQCLALLSCSAYSLPVFREPVLPVQKNPTPMFPPESFAP